MKFLILLFLVYLGYRVFIPKGDSLEMNEKSELEDGDFIDYEELEE